MRRSQLQLLLGACLVLFQVACGADTGDDLGIYLGSHPSLTGDGSAFVFEWNDSIWMASTTGGVARCLTQDGSRCDSPLVSSDGRRVVFASDREGCENHLFELDIPSGRVRQVSWHSEYTRPCAWCPGESNVICTVVRDHAGLHAQRLAVISLVRRAAEKVPFDLEAGYPSLAGDGRRLLFSSRWDAKEFRKRRSSVSTEAGEIWMHDLGTGAFTPMVREKADSRGAVWAPDGKGFYYLSGGVRNVFYRPVDAQGRAGEPVQITSFADDHVFDLAVSADGRVAVFRQAFDFCRLDLGVPGATPVRLRLRPEAGSRMRPLTRRRTYTTCWNDFGTGSVDFFADGDQIAMTVGGALYVMCTGERKPQVVYDDSLAHARDCAFASGGKVIYFTADRGDGADVWKAERKDPKRPWCESREFVLTRVTADGGCRRRFSVSPDGGSLAWLGEGGRLVFADSNGVVRARGPKVVSTGSYAWSPDGRYVLAQVTHATFQREIYLVSTEADDTWWPLTKSIGSDGSPAWSPDGAVLAWVSELPCGDGERLCYVYLDGTLEGRELRKEKAEGNKGESGLRAFENLIDSVRVTKVAASRVFFSSDSRTMAFVPPDGKGLKSVKIPNDLSPKAICDVSDGLDRWIGKAKNSDKGTLLGLVGGLPAHGGKKFGFAINRTTDVADYQEQAFRAAWGTIAHRYYDPGFHGVDWTAMRDKYLPYARNAGSVTVFGRVLQMMAGELDSSHVGYGDAEKARAKWEPRVDFNAWQEPTAHLGLRFDPSHRGAGWRIRDVVRGSPADLGGFGFAPGDIVEKVDGITVDSDTDPTSVLNGVPERTVRLTLKGREYEVKTVCCYNKVRELVGQMDIRARRERVHELSGGRFGYLDIAAMDAASLRRFQQDVFAEGVGRDGMVIDVRRNHGGSTADQMMLTLFGVAHTYMVARSGTADHLIGWAGRPVWSKPIVVLCGEESGSNAEIFSHAIKQNARGKLVGRATGGNVICTDAVSLLDYGTFRMPHLGTFLLDGRDMEYNGAQPDVEVDNLPGDLVRGVDRQLETAVSVLGEEVEAWKAAHPAREFRYAR